MANDLNSKFTSVYKKIDNLKHNNRYLGAFIFGSYARGEQDINSDFDVIVAVDKDNSCKEINHPIVDGVKLDLSFRSLKQIESIDNSVVEKGERIPIIAESIIVFDKTGNLKKLKAKFSKVQRKKATTKDYQMIQFMLYHADSKAKRNLDSDKTTALLAMSINLNDILKFHYHINGKWWLSNKRLLQDLKVWDPEMATLIERFVSTSNVNRKYKLWTKILEYVAKPLGGRKEIAEINCTCKICKNDLKYF